MQSFENDIDRINNEARLNLSKQARAFAGVNAAAAAADLCNTVADLARKPRNGHWYF